MTPFTREQYEAERANIIAQFEAVKPHTFDAWRVWDTVLCQALATARRRWLASKDGFERMIIAHQNPITVADYLESPLAERLAA